MKMTAALSLVVALGAYCPRVKLSDEKTLAMEKAKGKRRTRPLIGLGGYGKGLMAKFAENRLKEMKSKQQSTQLRKAA